MKSVPETTENSILVVFPMGANPINHGISNDTFIWFSACLWNCRTCVTVNNQGTFGLVRRWLYRNSFGFIHKTQGM